MGLKMIRFYEKKASGISKEDPKKYCKVDHKVSLKVITDLYEAFMQHVRTPEDLSVWGLLNNVFGVFAC